MRNPVKSKKGITIVELIVASAVSVIIMAAACTMFYVGSKSAKKGADAFINHGNAYTFETQLRNSLFSASDAAVYTDVSDVPAPDDNNNIVEIYFDRNKMLWVKTKSAVGTQEHSMANEKIKEVKLEKKVMRNADGSIIEGVKPAVCYTITAENDRTSFKLSGGMTMNNAAGPSAFSLQDNNVTITNTDTSTYFVIKVPK